MDLPSDTSLPFFAYGLFRPGQPGFLQLKEFVSQSGPASIHGKLLVSDGLPILNLTGSGTVSGASLAFKEEDAQRAYSRVAEMEPVDLYQWTTEPLDGRQHNVLCGKADLGEPWHEGEWDGWKDPLFGDALDAVGEILKASPPSIEVMARDLKPLFRVQMAYLLLWSAIERYISLRYGIRPWKLKKNRETLAKEPAFRNALARVQRQHTVHRTDGQGPCTLSRTDPQGSIHYYYAVRSNITHRGKGVKRDYDIVHSSLKELLAMFKHVLSTAEKDARTT